MGRSKKNWSEIEMVPDDGYASIHSLLMLIHPSS